MPDKEMPDGRFQIPGARLQMTDSRYQTSLGGLLIIKAVELNLAL